MEPTPYKILFTPIHVFRLKERTIFSEIDRSAAAGNFQKITFGNTEKIQEKNFYLPDRVGTYKKNRTSPLSKEKLLTRRTYWSFFSTKITNAWKDFTYSPKFTQALKARGDQAEIVERITDIRSKYQIKSGKKLVLDSTRLGARVVKCAERGDVKEINSMVSAFNWVDTSTGMESNKEALKVIKMALRSLPEALRNQEEVQATLKNLSIMAPVQFFSERFGA